MKKIYNLNYPQPLTGRVVISRFWIVNLIIALAFCFSASSASAQYMILKTEGFEVAGGAATNLPFGWTGGKIFGSDPNNFVERTTTGGAPAAAPHGGLAMLRYRSGFMVTAGESYFVSSPRYDLSNNPGTATVSFWMYKDTWNTVKDSLTLYINDSAAANASKGSMSKVIGPFSHDSTAFNGWKQYTAVIPAGYVTSSVYAVFVFTNREAAAGGANIYIDDFAIQTWPKPMALVSSTMIYQEISDVNKNATDQLIIGIKVTVDGAGDSLRVDSIVTNATGTTLLSDIVAASSKIWYTKGTNTFINNGNQFGVGITPTFFKDKFTQAGFFLENGDNYFWGTLSTTAGAISGDCIDLDFNGIYYRRVSYAGADTSRAPLVSSLLGCRQIDVALCGGVIPTLGTGTSWLGGSYTNNDYINRVYLRGANSVTPSYPYIDNNINDVGPALAPWNSGPAPFTVHPPDYQQFSQTASALHPNITCVLVADSLYAAPSLVLGNPSGAGLALQCGTWSSSNYMAAWIDFNKDGDLIDVGEQIHQSGPMNASTWTFAPVDVPALAGTGTYNVVDPARIVYGNVKMRIREVFVGSAILPCQSGYTFGEIEDYIVSVIPSCQAGVKLWLGYTNDWNTPSNWCGGVPTINDVALINEVGYLGGSQIGAPFDPVINAGTTATAKTIRLGATDTLLVNSPSSSSLQIADSLTISYNTPAGGSGLFKVNSAFSDTAQLSNGNVSAALISPFMGTMKNARMQLIYSKADLLAQGLIAGDVVDQFIFHIRARATTPISDYAGFTIKYATITNGFTFPPGVPTAFAPPTSAYTTLYTGTVIMPMAAGLKGDLTINLTTGMIWNGIDDICVELCFNNTAKSLSLISGYDQVCQTQTTGVNKVMWIYTTGTAVPGCALALPLVSPALGLTAQFRPNITFHYNRPYIKFPINVTGNAGTTAGRWVNHGNFIAGRSIVTFSNASLNQDIGGANVTTFCDLAVTKTGASGTNSLLMGLNANVDSNLVLNNGYIDLNQKLLTVNNPQTTSISRTAGWVESEDLPTVYGRLSKKIGTTVGNHLFPFGTLAGAYIPFTASLTAGDMGYLTAATYHTAADNTPYGDDGTPPGTVTHMRDSATGTDLTVNNVADRLWQLNKTGPSGTADLTFTITTAERPLLAGAADNTLKGQMWENPNGNLGEGWRIFPGAAPGAWSHSSATNSTTMKGQSLFTGGPWILSNITQPLPIELLSFDAKLVKDKVKIWWNTASEIDNDYFTVEKTINGDDFDFIAKVNSQGPSVSTQNYETYDMNPVVGLQYYRLKTTDVLGKSEYSKLVPVRYSKDGSFLINYVSSNYEGNSLSVAFTYDSNDPFTYSVVDILGRTLITKSGNAGFPGINTFNIPVNMNKGIYFVVIENKTKKVASKVIY